MGLPLRFGVAAGAVLAARAARTRRALPTLAGEVALVTGGSRGLGLLLARRLAAEGCAVAICARDPRQLDHARRELERFGTEVLAVRADVGDPAQVEKLVEEVTARLDQVDILVNNAGIIEVGPIASMRREDFEQAMDDIFWAALNPTLRLLPQMVSRGHGRIVNITSIGGKVSVPHLLPYSAAKFATVGVSEGLRAELAGTGVQVTTVVPFIMRTGSHLNALFKGRREAEYRRFALAATVPLASVDADRAAGRIVTAIRRGEAETFVGVQARVLTAVNGVAPATVSRALGIMNRHLMPEPDGEDGVLERGLAIEQRRPSRLLHAATTMGRAAARRNNEYPR